MSDLSRREVLGLLGLALAAGATGCRPETLRKAAQRAAPYTPTFFTADEYATVTVLADLTLPADRRGPSAGEAGVPEFMDFVMAEEMDNRERMRTGLAWLDTESHSRFGSPFVAASERQQKAILDDIAWPKQAKPEFADAASFFNEFRNLTATGYWSSQVGVEDLKYIGNTFVTEWTGCPEPQLKKLGVSYT
ncbi:MAG TPA: gluconate 2-dehydrogenase subunit 3 family protein [Gemmatimonadales bacterium]|nr:gluconate 2-dehydrogenase subunit 3 family protein [Gemmatimonadales bacterium]